ncbi:hypothetical protein C8F04DRAFT_1265496 [Mycena alexandri]|uniref:Transmembrane protein n=1 Tax=Mycena alexandri TaxID=1745969 RepID=A0AAD6SL25_9AGAR|nr:hypothetical protein C8F04DRAFT_1265496 [Mycena alexandri]
MVETPRGGLQNDTLTARLSAARAKQHNTAGMMVARLAARRTAGKVVYEVVNPCSELESAGKEPIIHTNTTSTIMAPYLIQPTVSMHYDEFEGVPTPVYSQTYAGPPTPTTDDGLRQFAIAMAIIGALFLVACVYTVAKYYLGKRRAELEVDDPELAVAAAFKPPTIAVPPLSATFGRVPAYQQERPFYISQADMLSGHGRGFFG